MRLRRAGLFVCVAVVLLLAVRQVWGPARAAAAAQQGAPASAPRAGAPVVEAFRSYVPAGGATPEPPLPPGSPHAIPDEYTLTFRDEAALRAFWARAQAAGLEVLGAIPELLAVRVRGPEAAVRQATGEGILRLDRNYWIRMPALVEPPDRWAFELRPVEHNVLQALGVPAWQDAAEWGRGVTIAILDTGWVGHAALKDARVRVLAVPGIGGDDTLSPHGTAVAGLIGSTDPFAPGVAPGAELLAIRVLDGAGRGDAFSLAAGILLAVHNGARVINMSLGGYGDSEVLRRAVAYAAARGVVLVASVGNDGIGMVGYPAAYPEVIAVTAVDARGNRPPFANHGPEVDIAAPGYEVHALWADDQYVYFNGTSAAAPLVAGMAARILQSGMAADPEGVRALLLGLADEAGPPGPDPYHGAGVLSAQRIEAAGKTGVYDIAVASFHPVLEEGEAGAFLLQVTFQNRGTEVLPATAAEVVVGSESYSYRFHNLAPGAVESVTVPLSKALIQSGQSVQVWAEAGLADGGTDSRPANNLRGLRIGPRPRE